MKKLYMVSVLVLLMMMSLIGCGKKQEEIKEAAKGTEKPAVEYKDGVYEIETKPDIEGYFCKAKVTFKNNKIEDIQWNIIDSNNRVFDETYEEVFAGNEHYQEQCRNDLKGAKTYGPKLIEVQDIDKVDAITGATWANSKFREVVHLALTEAVK